MSEIPPIGLPNLVSQGDLVAAGAGRRCRMRSGRRTTRSRSSCGGSPSAGPSRCSARSASAATSRAAPRAAATRAGSAQPVRPGRRRRRRRRRRARPGRDRVIGYLAVTAQEPLVLPRRRAGGRRVRAAGRVPPHAPAAPDQAAARAVRRRARPLPAQRRDRAAPGRRPRARPGRRAGVRRDARARGAPAARRSSRSPASTRSAAPGDVRAVRRRQRRASCCSCARARPPLRLVTEAPVHLYPEIGRGARRRRPRRWTCSSRWTASGPGSR